MEQISADCSLFHPGRAVLVCGSRMERLEQFGTVFRELFTVPSGGAEAREDGRKGVWHQGRCMQDTPRAVEAYSPIMDGGR